MLCTLEATLPNRLAVYCTDGHIMIDDFFLRPRRWLIFRGNGPMPNPRCCTTQWPGGGYTFQAQEVMRCLRAGELQSPTVPWADTLAVARTLERWQVGGRPHESSDCGTVMERLTGVIQPYAWGSPTVIPELLGVRADR